MVLHSKWLQRGVPKQSSCFSYVSFEKPLRCTRHWRLSHRRMKIAPRYGKTSPSATASSATWKLRADTLLERSRSVRSLGCLHILQRRVGILDTYSSLTNAI